MPVEVIDYNRTALHELSAHPEQPWSRDAVEVVHDARFEAALDSVLRWHNGVIHPPEGLAESDLGHVQGMEAIFDEFTMHHPTTASTFDSHNVNLLIRVHDMGEIIMGDLPPILRKDSDLYHKKVRGEPLAVTMMTRNLADPAKTEMRYLYHDYEAKASTEALLTKWLDVIQGNRFALNNQLYETIWTSEEKTEHVMGRITDMLVWTQALVRAVDEPTRLAIYEFTGKEMATFMDEGYDAYVTQAVDEFSQGT